MVVQDLTAIAGHVAAVVVLASAMPGLQMSSGPTPLLRRSRRAGAVELVRCAVLMQADLGFDLVPRATEGAMR